MPLCFAIMPISMPDEHSDKYSKNKQHFLQVATHLFKPAAEQAGYEFRAPTSESAEIIQADIIQNLDEADLVLCDISTWNANVFFELGIRVALNKPVAMVKDDLTPRIPFDNAMVNTYTYKSDLHIWNVEAEVDPLASFLKRAGTQPRNALWKYFGIAQQAKQPDPENPEDAKLAVILNTLQNMDQRLTGVEAASQPRYRERPPETALFPVPAFGPRVGQVDANLDTKNSFALFKNTIEQTRLTHGQDIRVIGYGDSPDKIQLGAYRKLSQDDVEAIMAAAHESFFMPTTIVISSPDGNDVLKYDGSKFTRDSYNVSKRPTK